MWEEEVVINYLTALAVDNIQFSQVRSHGGVSYTQ